MTDSHSNIQLISDFIERWQKSGAAERANYQLFLAELCDVLGIKRPSPTQSINSQNIYVFERSVTFQNGDGTTSTGYIDLYKRGCFVLEAKQGSEKGDAGSGLLPLNAGNRQKKGTAVRGTGSWDNAMLRARGQAEQYARALPADEGWPVFLITVDIGHTFELYADFTRLGKTYLPFPDAQSHRLRLSDLQTDGVRELLRAVWTDPLSLDPSRRSAREERSGLIRWLRPDFQNRSRVQTTIDTDAEEPKTVEKPVRKETRRPWPKTLPEQASALRSALVEQSGVVTAEEIAGKFTRARKDTVAGLLDTLASQGIAREVEPGRYTS